MAAVRARIERRSGGLRCACLQRLSRMAGRPRGPDRLRCANVAHAFAALPGSDRRRIVAARAAHQGVVTADNDMLSAHQPCAACPDLIRAPAQAAAATVHADALAACTRVPAVGEGGVSWHALPAASGDGSILRTAAAA